MIALFLTLLLAHAIGDFILQTNFIYKLKVQTIWGVVLHVFIFSMVLVGLTYPLILTPKFALWVGCVALIHLVQDHYKIKIRFKTITFGKEMFYFLADQSFHFLALVSVFFISSNAQQKYLKKLRFVISN